MTNEYDGQVLEKINDFFSPSLASAGSAGTRERVKSMADRFSRITGEKLKDLYATCDCEDQGKELILRDLWLFSERYIMLIDCLEPRTTDSESFRLFSARKRITSLRVTTDNYEFDGDGRSFNENSRLRLECVTTDNLQIDREARGPYCPRLARLIRQWILPNLG
jgi:hypothetical protein